MAAPTRATYRVDQISLAVRQSLQQPWTVADMATRLRLSESHLRRLFVGTTGLTPHQWLTDVRLQVARQLLGETDLSVKRSPRTSARATADRTVRFDGAALEGGQREGWRCGAPGGGEVAGLLIGLAGVGYGLLRCAARDDVPSVLTLDPPPA